VFKIEQGKFALTITDPTVTDACAATIADFDDFTCQITSGALNANPNVSDETIPATWCEPESTVPSVGATSYELAMSFLQDPDVVDGLSRFLFEHDTERAWFYMGLDGDDPPKAVGMVRLVAGTIGGEARVALVADITLPVDGKPLVCFGNSSSSENVGGGGGAGAATGATAGTPGTWTPSGSTPPANAAGATSAAVTATPTTAWTTGQYVQGSTAGTSGEMNWSGTAWAAGRHA
jgi:hypothetical protein